MDMQHAVASVFPPLDLGPTRYPRQRDPMRAWNAGLLMNWCPAATADAQVGKGIQSFKEFPPRQKPGSFNLERVMEAVTASNGG